eukprot:CAMPEP_0173277652 /NCGR_PEP_ID=MMETSP1143-20121109/4195_1 /TAXON_ID=483371 /ORGANISM="non described non described, Strain CCMP2298" /LENGTH=124 /DNA_ID=CAMNT_0014214759 /DNA_START=89 /DNA_END=460 /DNA_ORIENTATION=+
MSQSIGIPGFLHARRADIEALAPLPSQRTGSAAAAAVSLSGSKRKHTETQTQTQTPSNLHKRVRYRHRSFLCYRMSLAVRRRLCASRAEGQGQATLAGAAAAWGGEIAGAVAVQEAEAPHCTAA